MLLALPRTPPPLRDPAPPPGPQDHTPSPRIPPHLLGSCPPSGTLPHLRDPTPSPGPHPTPGTLPHLWDPRTPPHPRDPTPPPGPQDPRTPSHSRDPTPPPGPHSTPASKTRHWGELCVPPPCAILSLCVAEAVTFSPDKAVPADPSSAATQRLFAPLQSITPVQG